MNESYPPTPPQTNWRELRDLALLFGRLGATSFGGPVAHIALMEHEIVTRRKWLDRQHFLDLVGATNLIPGPNSTELAIHIGQVRAGWSGLIVAGAAFILPAMCIVLLLAWLYDVSKTKTIAQSILYGVHPVVIAIIAQALWKLARTAIKGAFTIAIAAAVVGLVLLKVNEVAALFIAAGAGLLLGTLFRTKEPVKDDPVAEEKRPTIKPAWALAAVAPVATSPTLWGLFLVFLKIGSIVYGSGYVLIAFLNADLVEGLGWLTRQQLVDAVAIGQVTPGPVFTTATFTGYQLLGVPGALVATLGIFLPSFVFVGLLSLFTERVRRSAPLRVFLDAVNAASLALMAVVTVELTRTALPDWLTVAVALFALAVLLWTRLNSVWLIAGGALLGLIVQRPVGL